MGIPFYKLLMSIILQLALTCPYLILSTKSHNSCQFHLQSISSIKIYPEPKYIHLYYSWETYHPALLGPMQNSLNYSISNIWSLPPIDNRVYSLHDNHNYPVETSDLVPSLLRNPPMASNLSQSECHYAYKWITKTSFSSPTSPITLTFAFLPLDLLDSLLLLEQVLYLHLKVYTFPGLF